METYKNKFTRQRMLDSFKELELGLEGHLEYMDTYYKMSDKELSNEHEICFDAMYEEGFDHIYDYNSKGEIIKTKDYYYFDKVDKVWRVDLDYAEQDEIKYKDKTSILS